MKENQAFENLISSGEYQYYVFYLNQPANVTRLRFRVSSPQTLLYVSRSDACRLANDTCAKMKGQMTNPVTLFKKYAQSSVYYVGVFSFSHTDYTVAVEVSRKDVVQKIKLRDAMPYAS